MNYILLNLFFSVYYIIILLIFIDININTFYIKTLIHNFNNYNSLLYIIQYSLFIIPTLDLYLYKNFEYSNNIQLLSILVFFHPILLFYYIYIFNRTFLMNIWKYNIYNIYNITFINFFILVSLLLSIYWSAQEILWDGFWNWDFVEISMLIYALLNIIHIHLNITYRYIYITYLYYYILFIYYLNRTNIINSQHSFNVSFDYSLEYYIIFIYFIFILSTVINLNTNYKVVLPSTFYLFISTCIFIFISNNFYELWKFFLIFKNILLIYIFNIRTYFLLNIYFYIDLLYIFILNFLIYFIYIYNITIKVNLYKKTKYYIYSIHSHKCQILLLFFLIKYNWSYNIVIISNNFINYNYIRYINFYDTLFLKFTENYIFLNKIDFFDLYFFKKYIIIFNNNFFYLINFYYNYIILCLITVFLI